jgi:hypothetical protein
MVTEKLNIPIKKFSLILYCSYNDHDFDSKDSYYNYINFDFLNLNDLGVIIFR